ncbi:MAG: cytochrome c biogenesis CcdA family protein, partial [Caldisericum sp.]
MTLSLAEILQAIIAGFVSFVSPCVLPLIPAYISYITGETLIELKGGTTNTKKLLFNSIAFVLGFSFVFILLGATATFVGKFLSRNKRLFEIIAGIIVIIFGLHTSQIVRFNFLSYEKKMNIKASTPSLLKAFLMGFAFSFGWTPCVGPILGTIL